MTKSNNDNNNTGRIPRLSASDLQELADHGFVVVNEFLSQDLCSSLQQDLQQQRQANKFKVAHIGQETSSSSSLNTTNNLQIQNGSPFRDIRISETCFLARPSNDEVECRHDLYRILDGLKDDLQIPLLQFGRFTSSKILPLDPTLEEVMYLYYPRGGYYRRHVDADAKSLSNLRQYSFILFLNSQWVPSNGGQLRIHRDSGGDSLPLGELPNFVDIEPKSGTLVLFGSSDIPHEVLETHKERLAIVGWFLSSNQQQQQNGSISNKPTVTFSSKPLIQPSVLECLQQLRQLSPKIKTKLEGSPRHTSEYKSGLIESDIFDSFMMGGPPPTEEKKLQEPVDIDYGDPKYWKPICTFTTDGYITTLSLGGQRLRKVPLDLFKSLLSRVVTLDLGNTDLSMDQLISIIEQCPSDTLQQLHLAGFGLESVDLTKLLSKLGAYGICTLDLRYNNIREITHMLPTIRVLHLEGNPLGDDGAASLANAIATHGSVALEELYLGQCQIGPDGAAVLARQVVSKHAPHLQKLYLEGNRILNQGALAFQRVLEEESSACKLEKLYVDNNGLDKEHALALGRAVKSQSMVGTSAFYE